MNKVSPSRILLHWCSRPYYESTCSSQEHAKASMLSFGAKKDIVKHFTDIFWPFVAMSQCFSSQGQLNHCPVSEIDASYESEDARPTTVEVHCQRCTHKLWRGITRPDVWKIGNLITKWASKTCYSTMLDEIIHREQNFIGYQFARFWGRGGRNRSPICRPAPFPGPEWFQTRKKFSIVKKV